MPDLLPEPWLRGTLADLPPLQRAVLHSFEMASEDIDRYCTRLSRDEINTKPFGLAPVSFHVRHIARSIDRLLTYAEGGQLSDKQLAALKTEMSPEPVPSELFAKFKLALSTAAERVRAFAPDDFDRPVFVGRKQLPTTVGGLLVHLAEHTQRHVGQAITTAKIVLASN